MAPDEAAGVLRGALAGRTGDTTIADAATKGGLALRDAELGLHRLLQVHRGHLSVTDKGELLFRFPTGFAIDYEARSRIRAAVRTVGRGAVGLAKWAVRLGLTVFLVGYSIVFAVGLLVGAIALSVVAEDGTPLEGAGYLLWGMGELLADSLFWSTHPRASLAPGDGDERHSRRFYERVNRFFFGPPQPAEDPRGPVRALAAEIRARRGRIGIGDVVRVTGLPRTEAEATVSKLLVDFDGHVDVTEDGAIVYRFPDLRPTAVAALPAAPGDAAPPAIWRAPLERIPFTGNTSGANATIVLLTAFVGVCGWVGTLLGLPFWAAAVPLVATLVFAAVPLVRVPFHVARQRRIADEQGRRALLQLAHDSACEARGVEQAALAAAWQEASGRTIAPAKLQRMLVEMGGDVVVDDAGRWTWRFPEAELEMRALAALRAAARDDEREIGVVEFTSMPADEQPPALAQGKV